MSFFKKLFHKKEIKLQDVFDALDSFDNDVKTLQNFSEIAYQYFGNSWKFNLEMYISSLPVSNIPAAARTNHMTIAKAVKTYLFEAFLRALSYRG